ncbi:MAG TPA: hypothetical protein VHB21_23970, partial [Minicystis sp.]|nr:hypothetical protein [Minicystis sp.]
MRLGRGPSSTWRLVHALALGVLLEAPRARADPNAAGGVAPPAPASALTFEARSLEAEGARVELAGGVVVGYGPYRLTADRIVVTQAPGAVAVEGSGVRLAPCPCPDPPVTLAFSSARFSESG